MELLNKLVDNLDIAIRDRKSATKALAVARGAVTSEIRHERDHADKVAELRETIRVIEKTKLSAWIVAFIREEAILVEGILNDRSVGIDDRTSQMIGRAESYFMEYIGGDTRGH